VKNTRCACVGVPPCACVVCQKCGVRCAMCSPIDVCCVCVHFFWPASVWYVVRDCTMRKCVLSRWMGAVCVYVDVRLPNGGAVPTCGRKKKDFRVALRGFAPSFMTNSCEFSCFFIVVDLSVSFSLVRCHVVRSSPMCKGAAGAMLICMIDVDITT